MKNDIIVGLMIFLLILLVCGITHSRMMDNRRKRMESLRRLHERQIDRKVILTRGKRFDCPRCGGTVQCKECRLHRI